MIYSFLGAGSLKGCGLSIDNSNHHKWFSKWFRKAEREKNAINTNKKIIKNNNKNTMAHDIQMKKGKDCHFFKAVS